MSAVSRTSNTQPSSPRSSRTGHEYFGKHRLRGEVLPERQEGGYMLVAPN